MHNPKPLPRLSIVVPCYNERRNIPLILKRFAEVIPNRDAELILINNGSTDSSQKIIELELKKPEYSFARTVLVPKNIGYGNGIYFGLQQAQGEILAYTHADMQCDPLDVIRAYQIISAKENPSLYLIKGRRTKRKIIPQILTTGLQLLSSSLFFKNFHEINAQPKVFQRELLEKLNFPPLDFNFDFYVLYKAKKEKLRIISIPVEFHPRKFGESSWDFGHLSKLKIIHKFIKYLLRLRFSGEEKAAEITYQLK
ncbi:MAG TPA: glycosyltransferase family 2 protein [Candidatus Nanoarchaeia archaeon]|nr:glycosyltransferase family 2 protein [Candidatus Nanoarchaeia archaeon]